MGDKRNSGSSELRLSPIQRPDIIKQWLKNQHQEEMARSNLQFIDRGLGTMADSLAESDVDRVNIHFWNSFAEGKSEEYLKHRADYLLSFALCARGDNLRNLHLSEVGGLSFENEGVHGAFLMRTVWRKSKKNQFGKMQQQTLMRHRIAERCAIGALAFYLFYR